MSHSVLRSTSIDVLTNLLESCGAHSQATADELQRYSGLADSTTKRGLANLKALGLIFFDSKSKKYNCQVDEIKRGTDKGALETLLAKAITAQRSFEMFCEGLAVGEREDDAIRKTIVLLGQPSEAESSLKQLIKWGEKLNLLNRSDGRLILSKNVQPSPANHVPIIHRDDLESTVKARLMISTHIGRSAYNAIDEPVRVLLAEAAITVSSKPEETCTKSGKAIEDYLRGVCKISGLSKEASKKNGAGQLANLLLQKKIVHPHHQKIVDLPSMTRNAVSHNKDKRTLVPWTVTSLAAWTSLLATLTAIRAIHEYVYNGRQIL